MGHFVPDVPRTLCLRGAFAHSATMLHTGEAVEKTGERHFRNSMPSSADCTLKMCLKTKRGTFAMSNAHQRAPSSSSISRSTGDGPIRPAPRKAASSRMSGSKLSMSRCDVVAFATSRTEVSLLTRRCTRLRADVGSVKGGLTEKGFLRLFCGLLLRPGFRSLR